MFQFARWLGATPPSMAIKTIPGLAQLLQVIHLLTVGVVLASLLLMVLPLVPIAQTKGWRRSLRGVGTMLDAGWSLIFFPEGERSRSGVRLPFRAGIGVVAGAMRAPVVPVFVDGFHSILPRDAFWPRRGGGRVIFGKPLSFPADADPEQVARAVEKAVDALGVASKR